MPNETEMYFHLGLCPTEVGFVLINFRWEASGLFEDVIGSTSHWHPELKPNSRYFTCTHIIYGTYIANQPPPRYKDDTS